MRVGPDVAPRWDVDSAAAIPGIEATQPSAKNATTVSLARTWMHRRLWVNDPDCLLVREGDSQLASHELDALAAAVAISGGAVFVSDDLAAVSPEGRARLRAVVAAARAADTLGVPGRVRGLDPLAARGPRVAVAADAAGGLAAFVNTGDARARRTLDLTALGLAPPAGAPNALIGAAVTVSDDGATTLDLAPHAGALLRVHRAAPLVVFCDFDGTFSVQDVGSTLARRHAGPRRPELWARFERGEITAWDYNLHVLDGLAVSRAEVDRFLAEVELDPGARDLVAWCAEREIPFRVLSDGFDHNLDRLQVLHGLRFAYDANRLRFDGGRWRIRPGHPNPSCSCGTGTCKRGRIEARRAADPDAAIVHIGNGRVSDLCGALAADVTFAKDSLADELTRRREPFEAFETLRDVIPRLEDMAGRIRASRPDR
jgi:2,3-diketo-5-methylthio-1-phosphopentane phosphatase